MITLPLTLFGGAFILIFIGVKLFPNFKYAGSFFQITTTLISLFILPSNLAIGLLISSLLIFLIGRQDEHQALSAQAQAFWQFTIILFAIIWGWSFTYLSHPFLDQLIYLNNYQIGTISFPGSFLTILWLFLLVNSINWLDGVDGLAPSVGVVALLAMASVSLLPSITNPTLTNLSLAGAGALLGLLVWNWPPAKTYLGTTGSWFLGLYLGLVALFGGGKLITTLLILALPVTDAMLVILQRLKKKQPIWQGDKTTHLHYRLKNLGLSDQQITLHAIIFTSLLAFFAITLQTYQKALALLIAAGLITAFVSTSSILKK